MNKHFSPHIPLAHLHWKEHLQKGDTVLDATCGNGHDTLFLVSCTLSESEGHVYAVDLQKDAVEKSSHLLQDRLSPKVFERVHFFQKSHENFSFLPDTPLDLIVYNLGYLPGGDKKIKTETKTTLSSIENGLSRLSSKGALCVTCYVGHEGGKKELETLLEYSSSLSSQKWEVRHHLWINRPLSPSILWIQKTLFLSK